MAESSPRGHHQPMYDWLLTLPSEELRRRNQMAGQSFKQRNTFMVYGKDEGTAVSIGTCQRAEVSKAPSTI